MWVNIISNINKWLLNYYRPLILIIPSGRHECVWNIDCIKQCLKTCLHAANKPEFHEVIYILILFFFFFFLPVLQVNHMINHQKWIKQFPAVQEGCRARAQAREFATRAGQSRCSRSRSQANITHSFWIKVN